jgi:hypothetical protein
MAVLVVMGGSRGAGQLRFKFKFKFKLRPRWGSLGFEKGEAGSAGGLGHLAVSMGFPLFRIYQAKALAVPGDGHSIVEDMAACEA